MSNGLQSPVTGKCKSCKFFHRVRSYSGTCSSGKIGTTRTMELDVVSVYTARQVQVGQDFGCIHWVSRKGDSDVSNREAIEGGQVGSLPVPTEVEPSEDGTA